MRTVCFCSKRTHISYRNGKGGKSVLLTDLAASPPFVCFDDIRLSYNGRKSRMKAAYGRNWNWNQLSIIKKCKLFEENLPLLRRALNSPNRIIVCAKIDCNNPFHFGNQTQFLDHIRQQLLSILSTSRHLEFDIGFGLDDATFGLASTNTLASILQFSPIKRCLNVQIILSVKQPVRLPITEISRWLNRKANHPEVSGKKKVRTIPSNPTEKKQNSECSCNIVYYEKGLYLIF